MNVLEIPEIGKKYYLPSDLSECSPSQYADLSVLIYQMGLGQIEYESFRTRALYKLLNLKRQENPDAAAEEEKLANIYQLSELVDQFFEDSKEGVKHLKQYYVHNPIKKVRPFVRAYYGPQDHFNNLKFGEYIDALNLFHEYHETRDEGNLYTLMATLYRPKKIFRWLRKMLPNYDGDPRQKYNPHTVEKRAKRMKLIDFGQVYGLFLLFASFQKYLATAKVYWQGQELDLSILFKTDVDQVKSDIPGLGMKSILFTLAESGAFGAIKELQQQPFWEIMLRMYDLAKRDADFKAQQEKAKTKQ